jgi:hypothetical protein
MMKAEEGVGETPLPPKGDGSNGTTIPIDEALKNPCMEQLSFELKQLKLQRKIDKLKKKLREFKSREVASSSSSNEETDASSEKEVKDRKGKREISNPTTLLPLIMIIYLTLAPSLHHPSVISPFRWDGLYLMELLDEDASNLAQSERLEHCACRC